MTTNIKYIVSILLVFVFGFNVFGQQISSYLDGEQKRIVLKVGKPILLFESVSIELKSMMVDDKRNLELVINVKNVSSPGSVGFGATTRIMRDAEGLQYEHQTIADWGSGGKRLLKGTELESTAKISLKDRNRNQRAIIPILIASGLRVSFYQKDNLISPYRRNTIQQAVSVILEIDRDELREVIQKYEVKPVPEPKRLKLPMLDLNMEKFGKLKFGMSYKDVVSILGVEGTNNRSMVVGFLSSSGSSFESESYEWRSAKFGFISCTFIKGGLTVKRFVNSTHREFKAVDLTSEKYDQLRRGMTYKQVKEIIGSQGFLLMTSATSRRITERFLWQTKEGTVTVVFRDGALSSKRRTGLN